MNKKTVYFKLIRLLKPFVKQIVLVFLCLLVTVLINLYIPMLNRNIMDDGFIGKNFNYLIKAAILLFVLCTINEIFSYLKQVKRVTIETALRTKLIDKFYDHLTKLRIGFFGEKNNSETLNNLMVDIDNMSAIADEGILFVISQVFNVIGGLIGLFMIDYRLTIFVIAFIPIKYFIMHHLSSKRERLVKEYLKSNEDFVRSFSESMNGMTEIRIFGIQNKKKIELEEHTKFMLKKKRGLDLIGELNFNIDAVLVQALTMIIYIVGSIYVFKLNLSIGSVFAFITYSSYVTRPITTILNVKYLLAGIVPSAKRYFEFMETEEEPQEGISIKNQIINKLEIKNLSFSYEGSRVLSNVNFIIHRKENIAILGENGAGKTTFINLILRFLSPDKGDIYLDGVNVTDYKLEDYRSQFSVVNQKLFLFNRSIRENITLQEEVEDEYLNQVICDSGLKEFVDKYSLDYIVGDNGSMISGGEKQKIALARALIKKRPIIIFDEATSNIDLISEKQIIQLVNNRLKDKMVIFITHRKALLEIADKIMVLQKGQLKFESDKKLE